MKRLTLLIFSVLMALVLFVPTATMQKQSKNKLQQDFTNSTPVVDALPQSYINDKSNQHKLIIGSQDQELYQQLLSKGAITKEIEYGSFKLVIVDENSLGGKQQLNNLSVAIRDDQDLIPLNGYILNTKSPDETYNLLPAELRQDNSLTSIRQNARPNNSAMYIVQFVGPIQDEWLDNLKLSGVDIISYIPSNAYIVKADLSLAETLPQMLKQNQFVQFVGGYEPAFRISPDLRAIRQLPTNNLVDVTIQVVDGIDAQATIDELKSLASEVAYVQPVLNYHNVAIKIDSSKLTQIAHMDNVFAVEERTERKRLDEAQGQILANNISGNAPSGPGYLSWLTSKGFTSSQFGSFAVNVVDDSASLTGHPDVPNTRIVFQNNPTAQTGAQGGHGFLNAHIVGGLNTGTGSAFEDASGYNYGLGIAPYARLGVTAIFGDGNATPTAWENTAYGQGARISSNSWGFIGTANRRYNASAQEFDRIVRDAQTGVSGLQQLTVVFAAGNDGSGANTVGSPATAKNIITVGAGENFRQTGNDGCGIGNTGANSLNDIISFSSRGPINSTGGDGRIKPDIMAPGTHVEAGIPQSNYDGSSVCNQYFPSGQTLYGWSSGTSHSCPAVAGGAALVYQDFLNKALAAPSPAMVKAYLMNSTTHMTGVGANDTLPSNNQGMGRMNLGRAFDGVSRILVDQNQVLGTTGQTVQVTGSVANTSQPFRVTLAWTDAPGPTTGAPWVNNLDLEVTINGNTYRGNVFSGANSVTGGTADIRNNSESVFIPAGVSGNFTVTVRGTNIAGDGVPGNADTTDQDFALVVYNASATQSSPTIGVSPTTLSFTATAGGANPANQALNISNTGTGTLNWSVSDNAAWLTLSPTTGTAPSATTASVNISGLAAGTYNGVITVTATGATNSPLSVPVSLTVNPPASNPTIGVSPTSLSFTATAGGANPANQAVNISNVGSGTLSWSVSDNAAWLTLSPTTGTAPSATTASVNISGLAAGTYNGVITVTATGATNSPLSVPVTLTVNPGGATELLTNGGFEVSLTPWVGSGTGALYIANGASPHTGTGYAYFGSANSRTGQTYQQITIPTGTAKTLTFFLNVTSAETTTTTQYDRLFVEVRSTSGALLGTLGTFSNLNKTASTTSYTQRSFSLASFAGQTVRIQFRVATDSSLITTFRVDTASVK